MREIAESRLGKPIAEQFNIMIKARTVNEITLITVKQIEKQLIKLSPKTTEIWIESC